MINNSLSTTFYNNSFSFVIWDMTIFPVCLLRVALLVFLQVILCNYGHAAGEPIFPNEKNLITALKQGGYVIFFRHGITKKTGEKVVPPDKLQSCQLQRNLSITGIQQTRAIGAAIIKLGIPIGKVYSSPYCRCLDTAKNIFGRFEISDALYFAIYLSTEERQAVTRRLKAMLATPPEPGKNTVLVSHTANLKEAANLWPKPEGVAHVFKPDGDGGVIHMGSIHPDAWTLHVTDKSN